MTKPGAIAKTLGVSILMLGLMAVAASAAQANWKLINSKGELTGVTEALLPYFVFKEVENKTFAFLWTAEGGATFTHLCINLNLIPMKMLATGSTAESKLRFTGCVTLINGSLSPPCAPKSLGEKGVLETNKLTATDVTSGIEYKAPAGKNFASLELGEECVIGESIPITGALFFEESTGTFGLEQVTHLFSQGKSSIGILGSPVSVDGALVAELGGEHAGLKWAG